ncbi:NnrS family protein [Tritonibacter scottomollicae]|uniref:NnrS family protein n=1 Tax=Tritonibacter scottomollicae TaxID=483013 RepID=A0ABZ0HF60_TRISK|nr:NnrS family protein [Tritonibacter scottomollicae]WOI32823.1 NnrS family protein [Tritonibacter scottomollicae]
MSHPQSYSGPAFLSYGFRPFFMAACLFAVVIIPLWMLIWTGGLTLQSVLMPADWHSHEMIFGYGSAVIAGFLFTAVPNWTGGMPTRGRPLCAMLMLWLAGRIAVFGAVPLPWGIVVSIDSAFLLVLAVLVAREIISGKNWRNLMVLVPVSLLGLSNLFFFAESALVGQAVVSRRLGLGLVIFLVLLIGGRIIPSFTRNWLNQKGDRHLPKPFGTFDQLSLLATLPALVVWGIWPQTLSAAVLMCLAAMLQTVRLARWRGLSTLRNPVLAMLHVAFLFAPVGMLANAAAAIGSLDASAGLHIWGIGAIGGMTVAVMMRATMGHTGRALVSGSVLNLAFIGLIPALLGRLFPHVEFPGGVTGLDLAALFWTLSFALLCWKLVPWLAMQRQDRKRPTPLRSR